LVRLAEDDRDAFEELAELLGPRLDALEPTVLDELGAQVPLQLAAEWFLSLLVDLTDAAEVPAHPLRAAYDYMTARGRALVSALAAQPLPWEDGFVDVLPADWIGRLGIEHPDPTTVFVTLVTLHRLPEVTRQVMRDRQVSALDAATCAARRGLSVEQADEHFRAARKALLIALDRHLGGGDS